MSAGEAWSGISLTQGGSTGDLTQLYPTWATVGINPATATNGQLIRRPVGGSLETLQVETDGTNGGIIQIWDLTGLDIGADVSSGTTVTNAQLVLLQAAGKAKLIYEQNFVASAVTPAPGAAFRHFQKGLAARAIGSGTVKLNLVVEGGFILTQKVG